MIDQQLEPAVDVEDVVDRPDDSVHRKTVMNPRRELDPAEGWLVDCECGQTFRGLTPGECDARLGEHIFERDAAHLRDMIERLASFVMDKLPHEVNPELGQVDAVSIAIRVLQQYVDHPNGRLEPVVRQAIDQLDNLPGGGAEAILDQVRAARLTLKTMLILPPRPGGGDAPSFESDDITLVRYERDRFRVDYLGACGTIAEMYAAATGRVGQGPIRGVVEDLTDVRLRRLAAEEALTVALRHRCDVGVGDVEPPRPGTPAYAQWHRMVQDMVSVLVGPPKDARQV